MRAARASGMPTATSTSTSTWPSASWPPATRTRSSPRSCQQRVANGTCYTFPVEDGIALAEEIKRRFGCDLVRFSQLRHRGDDGRHPRRPRLHRPREDRQVRGRLPRPPRRRARLDPAAARADRPDRRARRPCRPRPGCRALASTRRSSRRSTSRSAGRDPRAQRRRDRGDHRRAGPVQHRRGAADSPATWSASASWPPSMAPCSSSTRSRPASCSRTAARTEWFGVKPDLFCLAKVDRRRRADRRVRRTRRRHGRDRDRQPAPRGHARRDRDSCSSTRRFRAARPASPTSARSTAIRCRWPPVVTVLTQILTRDAYPKLKAMGDRLTAGWQPEGDRRVRAARLRRQRRTKGLRDVHAGAGDQLSRLQSASTRSCGRRPSSTWPTAASCCRPGPTTSGRCRSSTPTRRSTATSRPSATSPPSSPPEHRAPGLLERRPYRYAEEVR